MPYYQISQVIASRARTLLWKKYFIKPPREIKVVDKVNGIEAHFKTNNTKTEGMERFFGNAKDIELIILQQVDAFHKPIPNQDFIKYESKRIFNV